MMATTYSYEPDHIAELDDDALAAALRGAAATLGALEDLRRALPSEWDTDLTRRRSQQLQREIARWERLPFGVKRVQRLRGQHDAALAELVEARKAYEAYEAARVDAYLDGLLEVPLDGRGPVTVVTPRRTGLHVTGSALRLTTEVFRATSLSQTGGHRWVMTADRQVHLAAVAFDDRGLTIAGEQGRYDVDDAEWRTAARQAQASSTPDRT